MSITMTNNDNNENAMTTLFGDLILKLFRENGAYKIHDFGDATVEIIEVMTEEVFNNNNSVIRLAIEAKEVWTTDEVGQFNTVLAEAVEEFGYDLIKDKDFIQRIELYVYLQAKEMGIELVEELKTKQEEEEQEEEVNIEKLQEENKELTNYNNILKVKLTEKLTNIWDNSVGVQIEKVTEENEELKRKLELSDKLIKILKKEVMPIQEAIAEHEADLQQIHQEEMDTIKQELFEKYQEEECEKIEDLTQNYNEQISDLNKVLESYEQDGGAGQEYIKEILREELEAELTDDLATHIGTYIRERNWA